MTSDFSNKHCEACEGIGQALSKEQVENLLPQLDKKWSIKDNGNLCRTFQFHNFYETMAFVNGIAWMANRENHHPDLGVGYNYCEVNYITHALNGLSMNDFICAAKVDALVE